MKKVIFNIALAVAVMGLTAACNCSGNKTEEPIDTVAEEVVVEDTTPVEEVVAEEVAPETKVAPAPKKEEPKLKVDVNKQEKQGVSINTKNTETQVNNDGSVSIKAGKTKVEFKGDNTTASSDGTIKATKKR